MRQRQTYLWCTPPARPPPVEVLPPARDAEGCRRGLHTSYGTVKVLWHKLKHRGDFARLCPLCLNPSRLNGGCSTCGAEIDHNSGQTSASYDTQSPVHRILEGKGLGSEVKVSDLRRILRPANPSLTSYKVNGRAMRLNATLRNSERRREDPLARAVKSDVLQALKEACPDDQVRDIAARMIEHEVSEFRLKYAGLSLNPKGLREATGRIVLARLEILYPQLRGKLQLPEYTRRKVSRLTGRKEG